jgi:hypothetical protein
MAWWVGLGAFFVVFLVGSDTAPLSGNIPTRCYSLKPQNDLDIEGVSTVSGLLIGRLLNNSTSTTKTVKRH